MEADLAARGSPWLTTGRLVTIQLQQNLEKAICEPDTKSKCLLPAPQ